MPSRIRGLPIVVTLAIVFLSTTSWLAPSGLAAAPLSDTQATCLPPGSTGQATPATPAVPAVAVAATPDSGIVTSVEDVPLSGGSTRFDYQSLDPTTGLLYLAHMGDGQLLVFDTAAKQVVATVNDLPSVTGVLAVPELGEVYASVSVDHQVAVIDTKTNQVVAHLGPIGFPDGLDFVPGINRVFVSDESGGGELVIDAANDTVVTTIDVGGEAGNTRYDSNSGCVLVAVQSRNQLVAIDPQSNEVAARFDVDPECEGPHGFTIDPANRLLFLSCEGNAALLSIDLTSMQTIGTFTVGEGPDVLAFDPAWHRLYVASEAGVVSIFDERNGSIELSGTYEAPHAHSVAVDLATHLVYLPLQDVDGKPVLRVATLAPPSQ